MTDREYLEFAAKAAGIEVFFDSEGDCYRVKESGNRCYWNPLSFDGDALRLAVKCGIDLRFPGPIVQAASDSMPRAVTEDAKDDPYAATRRAIVRAAAEIGRSMA